MAQLFTGALHSSVYSLYRLSPPAALIDRVITYLKSKALPPLKLAVDIGCGTGHSTTVLAPHFQDVVGLDTSESQIINAQKSRSLPNINYRVSSAENTNIADSSVDLVTVGQALHWFDVNTFFPEVKRILGPNGVVAVYGYWIPTPCVEYDEQKSKELRHLIRDYWHDDVLGQYWDSRRYTILKLSYGNVEFPFDNVIRESFVVKSTNTVADYMGYLSTWSAYETLRLQNPDKAKHLVEEIQERIMTILKSNSTTEKTTFSVTTDFFLTVGSNPA